MSRRTAWRIAGEQGWHTTFATEYLAVTRLQADALVTVDPELSVQARDLVPLAPFEALFIDQKPFDELRERTSPHLSLGYTRSCRRTSASVTPAP